MTRVREKPEEAGTGLGASAASAPARACSRACPVQEPKAGAVPVPAVVGGAWGGGGGSEGAGRSASLRTRGTSLNLWQRAAGRETAKRFLSSWPVHA